jgi:hypothetical protein
LQKPDSVPIPHVEALGLLPGAVDHDPPVGQYPIHVQEKELDPSCFLADAIGKALHRRS